MEVAALIPGASLRATNGPVVTFRGRFDCPVCLRNHDDDNRALYAVVRDGGARFRCHHSAGREVAMAFGGHAEIVGPPEEYHAVHAGNFEVPPVPGVPLEELQVALTPVAAGGPGAGGTPTYSRPVQDGAAAQFYFPYLFRESDRRALFAHVYDSARKSRCVCYAEHARTAAAGSLMRPFLDIDVSPDLAFPHDVRTLALEVLAATQRWYAVRRSETPAEIVLLRRVYPNGKRSLHMHFPWAAGLNRRDLLSLGHALQELPAFAAEGVLDLAPLKNGGLSLPFTAKRPDDPPLLPVGWWTDAGADVTFGDIGDLFEACRLLVLESDPVRGRPAVQPEAIVRIVGHRVERLHSSGKRGPPPLGEPIMEWVVACDYTMRIRGSYVRDADSRNVMCVVTVQTARSLRSVAIPVGAFANDPTHVHAALVDSFVRQGGGVTELLAPPAYTEAQWRAYVEMLNADAEHLEVVYQPGYYATRDGRHEGWVSYGGREMWAEVSNTGREIVRRRVQRPDGLIVALEPSQSAPVPLGPRYLDGREWIRGLLGTVMCGRNAGATALAVGAARMLLNHQTHRAANRDVPLVVLCGSTGVGKSTVMDLLAHAVFGQHGVINDNSTAAALPRFSAENPGHPAFFDDPGKVRDDSMAHVIQHSNPSDKAMATGVLRKRGGIMCAVNPAALDSLSRDSSVAQRAVVVHFNSAVGQRNRAAFEAWTQANRTPGLLPWLWFADLSVDAWDWAERHVRYNGTRLAALWQLLLAETYAVFFHADLLAELDQAMDDYFTAHGSPVADPLLPARSVFEQISTAAAKTYDGALYPGSDFWFERAGDRIALFLAPSCMHRLRSTDAGRDTNVGRALREVLGGAVIKGVARPTAVMRPLLEANGALRKHLPGILDMAMTQHDRLALINTEAQTLALNPTGNFKWKHSANEGGLWIDCTRLGEMTELADWGSLGAAAVTLSAPQ
jgi:hypothetical protein